MSELKTLYDTMIRHMGIPGLEIPMTAVTIFRGTASTDLPPEVLAHIPKGITLTSCQALKQASLGDAVCLTRDNIGCVAAAITFGLVDQYDKTTLEGSRVYTDIMEKQSGKKEFVPPSPNDFTEGIVYACHEAGRSDFALFGKNDSGRYKNRETAKAAIRDMAAIQPPDTRAVFFFNSQTELDTVLPDVVVFSVRPVELTRMIQAYQYNTGKRVNASMGGLRVVNSDLIVRPYLTGDINVSTYCLGARLIAQYEGNRMGIGIPWPLFKQLVQGMKDSETGFPFHLYPDAATTDQS